MQPSGSYKEWIANWLSDNNPYGQCKEATTLMTEAFPELKAVRGHVYCAWGKRGHFWCVDPQGKIIDPTGSQFDGGIWDYEPWEPGMEVRAGKCMNCGDEIWESVDDLDSIVHKDICSERCARDFENYLNGV